MLLAKTTAPWAVRGTFALISALALAGCSDAFGTSPPHAAPANPVAEGGDGEVELRWGAVTDAARYVILWRDETLPAGEFSNSIKDIEETTYTHTGLVNLRRYEYRIVA
ncbi:MAG: fibronectin type III domain-containing protein, partial [Pseudomonadota bacterium]|nr:fibronectin type III domain-containing protein [Pseudomonadota bacterium]